MPRDFQLVYQPKPVFEVWGLAVRLTPDYKRRFLVSPNKLASYIGEESAESVLEIAAMLRVNKKRKKLRKMGLVDIYLK